MVCKTVDKKEATSYQRGGIAAIRRCPDCGRRLYTKLENCFGRISIKCPKCGRVVCMDLALRRATK